MFSLCVTSLCGRLTLVKCGSGRQGSYLQQLLQEQEDAANPTPNHFLTQDVDGRIA